MNTMEAESFPIRAYGRTELAQCYFPLFPQPSCTSECCERQSPQPHLYAGSSPYDSGGDRGAVNTARCKEGFERAKEGFGKSGEGFEKSSSGFFI